MPGPTVDRRSVAALLAYTLFSASGALALATVLGKHLYDLTGRKLDLGLLGLAEFAPAFALVLVTGAIADRLDRRLIGAVATVAEAAAAIAIGWYVAGPGTAAWPIFALAAAFGGARAFAAPATRALPTDIVDDEDLPWLVPRRSATWQIALIVGPVFGGFLATTGEQAPYIAIAVLALLSGGSLLLIRLREPARTRPRSREEIERDAIVEAGVEPVEGHVAPSEERATMREALEGLRFIRGHPVVLGAISLDLFAVLFGGAVALLPAIAKDNLHVGAVGLGWLRAAGGFGAGAVTLCLALRPIRRRVGRILLATVAAFGVFTIALGVTSSFVVAFVALALLSGADAISVFIRATLVPLVTPADKRGRVLAVENVFIGASNELGAFESGVAGQLLGTAGAITLGGAATLVVAGTWWFMFPGLRDVDAFPTE